MYFKLRIISLCFVVLNCIHGSVIKEQSRLQDTVDSVANVNINNRPIIGILSQELDPEFRGKLNDQNSSAYIAASYVKIVEGSGALPLPIWIGQSESYYENILSKINGVIFPGGDSLFNETNGYADAGKIIYKISKKLNKNGVYFPVMGICLGFELLTFLEANSTEHRISCSSMKQTLPLEFKEGYRNSRLFSQVPEDVLHILKHENVTANYHRFCVTEEALDKVNISRTIRVTSLNKDWNGLEFISTLEHTNYPFYGLQFHPEKNSYEWVVNRNIPHSFNATKAGRYFMDFFVNEARRNMNSFPSLEEESKYLIYNYPVSYTALKKNSVFLQTYLFDTKTIN